MSKFNEMVNQLLNEEKEDNVYFVKQGNTYTLWVAYSPGSGTTSIFEGGLEKKTYITDKKGEERYDDLVRKIVKQYPINKVIKVPVYEYNRDPKQYDIWGGPQKSKTRYFMVITKDANHVVSFFDNMKEAQYRAGSTK